MITLDDVREAAGRLRGAANATPVLTSRTLDGLTGSTVLLKAENFQRGGAFKFRGAYNRISRLSAGELERGVAAYSSAECRWTISTRTGGWRRSPGCRSSRP